MLGLLAFALCGTAFLAYMQGLPASHECLNANTSQCCTFVDSLASLADVSSCPSVLAGFLLAPDATFDTAALAPHCSATSCLSLAESTIKGALAAEGKHAPGCSKLHDLLSAYICVCKSNTPSDYCFANAGVFDGSPHQAEHTTMLQTQIAGGLSGGAVARRRQASTASQAATGTFKIISKAGSVVFVAMVIATILAIYLKLATRFIERNVRRVFEKGSASSVLYDSDAWVDRDDLHKLLKTHLRPSSTDTYTVIVGEHGSGKSTAVCKACRDSSDDGPNGVVYFDVGSDEELFGPELLSLVGLNWHLEFFRQLARALGHKEDGSAKHTAWRILTKPLLSAADSFRTEYRRPMTLVLDNAQNIYKWDPVFFFKLQAFAKDAADKGSLVVVFVGSDYSVMRHMQSKSEWTRAKVVEVHSDDIPDKMAVKYLTKKFGWKSGAQAAAAWYIVKRITGPHFALLNSVDPKTDTIAKAKLVEEALHERTAIVLTDLKLDPRHKLFKCMSTAPGMRLKLRQLRETGISQEQHAELVRLNILVEHTNASVTCAERYIQFLFKLLSGARV
eukprot:GDKI01048650.1.p1 GENE.GDKI01048650.1~~GDKI01048650.1.p1  ORF type:complete len:586 (+),score=116.82 GDKI01048650.1:75-1760(+)